jgi:hypothetical protein
VVPVRQGLPLTLQAVPAVQATQAPLLQTMFWPQTVPFACACCVSVQLATLPEQVTLPRWQRLVGVQAAPGVHVSVPPSVVSWWPPAPAMPPAPCPPGPPAWPATPP